MKRYKLLILLIIFLLSLVCFYYYIFNHYNIGISCLFHELTGLDCPGCGITRLLFSLLELDFYQAFRYNPLIFISLPFLIFYLIDYIIKTFTNRSNYLYKRINNKTWLILFFIVLIFGILRNVPGFEFLKPTDIL